VTVTITQGSGSGQLTTPNGLRIIG
jgi:hypothetical protein